MIESELSPPTYEGLCELEPRLVELEERTRAIHDPGGKRFFCSNHTWLPISVALRELVGVSRPGWANHSAADPLYDGRAYETAYIRLSELLPPCRGCGCLLFEGLGRNPTT